jgi:K+ transporter
MARTLQAAALPRIEARQLPAAATLTALGVVYGDIGTSPLYGFKQAADADTGISMPRRKLREQIESGCATVSIR